MNTVLAAAASSNAGKAITQAFKNIGAGIKQRWESAKAAFAERMAYEEENVRISQQLAKQSRPEWIQRPVVGMLFDPTRREAIPLYTGINRLTLQGLALTVSEGVLYQENKPVGMSNDSIRIGTHTYWIKLLPKENTSEGWQMEEDQ